MVSATIQRQYTKEQSSGQARSLPHASLPHLPPGERDFLLFEALACEGLSTRQAAERFDISQTRVMQIRKSVAEWIARSVPEGLDLAPRERLRLAAYIANGRVDSLYCEAMQAWRESKAPATSTRSGQSGELHITRSSHGDPRYLLAASRLIDRQMSLAVAAARVLAEAERIGEPQCDGESPSAPPQEAQQPIAPPVRDCSPNSPQQSDAATLLPMTAAINHSDEPPSSELEERRQAFLSALADDTSPVHPPFTDAAGMLQDASQPTTATAPLNRQQRRARQRQLERLRRKPR
jgi:hypothetical protein